MGTRGVIGFYKNGKGKITYNHWDSYPEYLGINILKELRDFSIEEMNRAFDSIKLVDENDKPEGEDKTYYELLRDTQGTLLPYLRGKLDIMIDNEDFLKDSLFCEWGYIINLDTNILEVYKGFQEEPQKNRYEIKESENGYYNCSLIVTFDLKNLPMDEEFLEEIYGIDFNQLFEDWKETYFKNVNEKYAKSKEFQDFLFNLWEEEKFEYFEEAKSGWN